jgi:hypothetical protein
MVCRLAWRKESHRYGFSSTEVKPTSACVWLKFYMARRDSDRNQKREAALNKNFADLKQMYEPLAEIARERYPGQELADAAAALAQELHPKLVYLHDGTTKGRNEQGYVVTKYYFRAAYPLPLRDVQIRLEFDGKVLDAKYRFIGASVADQGSRVQVASDEKTVTFSTGLLKASNDISIEVISEGLIEIVRMELKP